MKTSGQPVAIETIKQTPVAVHQQKTRKKPTVAATTVRPTANSSKKIPVFSTRLFSLRPKEGFGPAFFSTCSFIAVNSESKVSRHPRRKAAI